MSKSHSIALPTLINSLKPSEKRYFRMMEEAESKSSLYLQVFESLEKSGDYDEKELLLNIKNLKKKQLSNVKAHLYKKILNSLRSYNQQSVIDLQIRELIDYAQLLFNRSLYDQCVDVLKKAKKSQEN